MNTLNYPGNYLGIVVQNNDPEKRGRVKVFVPHISPAIYKNWDNQTVDQQIRFIGDNTGNSISPILTELKNVLPWAECAAPLIGEVASGRYNATRGQATISDSNNTATAYALSSTPNLTEYSQNTDGIGEKPSNQSQINPVSDAFLSPQQIGANNANPYSQQYIPNGFSNSAKGAFSIPNVGARVWVFFNAGDPMWPVYFAAAHDQAAWQSVYSNNYPGTYENTSLSAASIDSEIYRNQFVVNQKGGTIQIVNTDRAESLSLTHYSGSFKKFTTATNIELATRHDQKLVIGDQFSTVRGSTNNFTGCNSDNIIAGDQYIKIGKLDASLMQQWREIVSEISNIKQLFEIQRATAITDSIISLTSTLQTRNGTFARCPVCSENSTRYWRNNNTTGAISTAYTTSKADGPYLENSVEKLGTINSPEFGVYGAPGKIFGDTCPSCGGSGESVSTAGGNWITDAQKNNLTEFIKSRIPELTKIEQQMGLGGSQIIEIAKHKVETIGLAMNNFGSVRVDAIGKIRNAELVVATEGVLENKLPSPLIEYVHVDELPGGTYSLNVCNKFSVLVGSGGINMKTTGPINITGTITNVSGTQLNLSSEHEINIDGGQRLEVTADIVCIKQRNKKQVLVDSSLGISKNVIIGGGCHVEGELTVNHITAPGEIQQTEQTTVFGTAATDSTGRGIKTGTAAPLYVTPGGSPSYVGIPDPSQIIGYGYGVDPDSGLPIFVTVYGSGLPSIRGSGQGQGGASNAIMPIETYGTGALPDCHVAAAHSHNFKNIPLTLTESNDDMRKAAKNNNEIERVPSNPIDNRKKD